MGSSTTVGILQLTISCLESVSTRVCDCRITCNGESAESRTSPQQAWAKLHAGQKERLSGQEGLLAFGLKSPQVRQYIQQLPNATRCERYSCWGEDSVPEKVKLVCSW